ncbi:hypothetical protein J8N05_01095 [Streptomyces sp. BH-SS-21]|uniref:Uncharacterized protein n=1 Tax=Streptomyces liliiviolaceus TaxID=2823109 RepID=A0A940XTV2_9ACTN|nr:hypothetical protein [Streptomyces liliiviolaceus]MBQ0846816.1 hypothetical protein [Streptomyces liliiviolaceus]
MEGQKEAELSATGAWIVGAVPEQTVRTVLSASVQHSSPAQMHGDVSVELAWWRSKAQASMFTPSTSSPGDWSADEDALRLSAFFDACHDDSDQAEELRDTVMALVPSDAEEGLFVATARKADPFSALAYALGPDGTLRLPGRFGDFLLDAGQVRAQLPSVEETLALTGIPRHDAIERIHAWMTGLGDDPAHNADELLDGPLRVLRHAARTGQGVAGQVRWY